MRRSWLTAASSAVRSRSASASEPAAAACLGEPLLAQRDGGLGGERLEDRPVGRGQGGPRSTSVQVVVDGHVGVAFAGVRHGWPPTLAATRQARWRRAASGPDRRPPVGVPAG